MPDLNPTKRKINLRIFPHGIMLVLVISIIFLSVMAFVNPAAQGATATPELTSTSTATEGGSDATQPSEGTGIVETLPPPTPEEIGSTNGIIFWSTILVLILLFGTLRKTLFRKGR